jgi:hypothetical protein
MEWPRQSAHGVKNGRMTELGVQVETGESHGIYALLPILAASFKESQWKRLNCSPAPQLQIDSPIADKQKTEEDLLTYSALSLSLPLAVGPHQ